MPVIPAGYGEVSWHWKCGDTSHEAVTTLGVALGGETSQAGLLAWHTAAMNDLVALLSFDYVIDHISLRIGGTGETIDADLDHHGGVGADAVSPAVSLLLKKSTGLGGRSHRGRMFVPGLPESKVTSAGVVLPSDRVNFDAAAADLLVTVGNIDGAFLLHSTEAETPTQITGIVTSDQVGTMKRRQRR